MAAKSRVEVFGLLDDVNYVRAKCCAEDIYKRCCEKLEEPVIVGMLQFEWDIYINEKKRELRGEAWQFNEKAITFVDGDLIGGPNDFIQWANQNYNFEEFRPKPLHLTLTDEGYVRHLNTQNHDYIYLDICIGEEEAGRLVIELFSDEVPKTCANFKALCTGEKGTSEESDYKLTYLNSLFHRIVPNGWIQGGDIYHGRGNGGESIYGAVFEDENFSVPHNRRGIVGMANKGRHSNQSQFYITLQPTPWMDTKYVAFGQVIEGTDTLRKMELEETLNERPMREIKVTKCGILTFEF